LEIIGVSNIEKDGDATQIFLNVALDRERALRWEIRNPVVLVEINNNDDKGIGYIDMLDGHLAVHSFDLEEEDIRDIKDYIKSKKLYDIQ
jgi:hypothetical protein